MEQALGGCLARTVQALSASPAEPPPLGALPALIYVGGALERSSTAAAQQRRDGRVQAPALSAGSWDGLLRCFELAFDADLEMAPQQTSLGWRALRGRLLKCLLEQLLLSAPTSAPSGGGGGGGCANALRERGALRSVCATLLRLSTAGATTPLQIGAEGLVAKIYSLFAQHDWASAGGAAARLAATALPPLSAGRLRARAAAAEAAHAVIERSEGRLLSLREAEIAGTDRSESAAAGGGGGAAMAALLALEQRAVLVLSRKEPVAAPKKSKSKSKSKGKGGGGGKQRKIISIKVELVSFLGEPVHDGPQREAENGMVKTMYFKMKETQSMAKMMRVYADKQLGYMDAAAAGGPIAFRFYSLQGTGQGRQGAPQDKELEASALVSELSTRPVSSAYQASSAADPDQAAGPEPHAETGVRCVVYNEAPGGPQRTAERSEVTTARTVVTLSEAAEERAEQAAVQFHAEQAAAEERGQLFREVQAFNAAGTQLDPDSDLARRFAAQVEADRLSFAAQIEAQMAAVQQALDAGATPEAARTAAMMSGQRSTANLGISSAPAPAPAEGGAPDGRLGRGSAVDFSEDSATEDEPPTAEQAAAEMAHHHVMLEARPMLEAMTLEARLLVGEEDDEEDGGVPGRLVRGGSAVRITEQQLLQRAERAGARTTSGTSGTGCGCGGAGGESAARGSAVRLTESELLQRAAQGETKKTGKAEFDALTKPLSKQALALFKQGDFVHAGPLFEKAADAAKAAGDAGYAARGYTNLANCLRKQGQLEQMLVAGDKAIEADRTHWSGWFARGRALLHLERYDEAAESLQEALDRNPEAEHVESVRSGLEWAKTRVAFAAHPVLLQALKLGRKTLEQCEQALGLITTFAADEAAKERVLPPPPKMEAGQEPVTVSQLKMYLICRVPQDDVDKSVFSTKTSTEAMMQHPLTLALSTDAQAKIREDQNAIATADASAEERRAAVALQRALQNAKITLHTAQSALWEDAGRTTEALAAAEKAFSCTGAYENGTYKHEVNSATTEAVIARITVLKNTHLIESTFERSDDDAELTAHRAQQLGVTVLELEHVQCYAKLAHCRCEQPLKCPSFFDEAFASSVEAEFVGLLQRSHSLLSGVLAAAVSIQALKLYKTHKRAVGKNISNWQGSVTPAQGSKIHDGAVQLERLLRPLLLGRIQRALTAKPTLEPSPPSGSAIGSSSRAAAEGMGPMRSHADAGGSDDEADADGYAAAESVAYRTSGGAAGTIARCEEALLAHHARAALLALLYSAPAGSSDEAPAAATGATAQADGDGDGGEELLDGVSVGALSLLLTRCFACAAPSVWRCLNPNGVAFRAEPNESSKDHRARAGASKGTGAVFGGLVLADAVVGGVDDRKGAPGEAKGDASRPKRVRYLKVVGEIVSAGGREQIEEFALPKYLPLKAKSSTSSTHSTEQLDSWFEYAGQRMAHGGRAREPWHSGPLRRSLQPGLTRLLERWLQRTTAAASDDGDDDCADTGTAGVEAVGALVDECCGALRACGEAPAWSLCTALAAPEPRRKKSQILLDKPKDRFAAFSEATMIAAQATAVAEGRSSRSVSVEDCVLAELPPLSAAERSDARFVGRWANESEPGNSGWEFDVAFNRENFSTLASLNESRLRGSIAIEYTLTKVPGDEQYAIGQASGQSNWESVDTRGLGTLRACVGRTGSEYVALSTSGNSEPGNDNNPTPWLDTDVNHGVDPATGEETFNVETTAIEPQLDGEQFLGESGLQKFTFSADGRRCNVEFARTGYIMHTRCVRDADAIAAAALTAAAAGAAGVADAADAAAEVEEAEPPIADGAAAPEEEDGGAAVSMLDSDSWSEDSVASQPQLSKALFLTQRLLCFFKGSEAQSKLSTAAVPGRYEALECRLVDSVLLALPSLGSRERLLLLKSISSSRALRVGSLPRGRLLLEQLPTVVALQWSAERKAVGREALSFSPYLCNMIEVVSLLSASDAPATDGADGAAENEEGVGMGVYQYVGQKLAQSAPLLAIGAPHAPIAGGRTISGEILVRRAFLSPSAGPVQVMMLELMDGSGCVEGQTATKVLPLAQPQSRRAGAPVPSPAAAAPDTAQEAKIPRFKKLQRPADCPPLGTFRAFSALLGCPSGALPGRSWFEAQAKRVPLRPPKQSVGADHWTWGEIDEEMDLERNDGGAEPADVEPGTMVYHHEEDNDYSIALGSQGFSDGVHEWDIQISAERGYDNREGVTLGVITRTSRCI